MTTPQLVDKDPLAANRQPPSLASAQAAKAAGLRYVTDRIPGIQRKRAGKHFRYVAPDGQPIHDEAELERIKSLVIPPAWTDVWISPLRNGHLQATGRDEKGRKQYLYHPRWREVRDATKYHKMVAFGEALSEIREKVAQDLALRGLPRERILATVVELIDETSIRIGNEEYARENNSFGLTTLRQRHVDVNGSTLHFHFVGKGGKEHEVDVRDRRIARIVKRMEDLPGQELFQYVDEHGQRHSIESSDVNEYLHRMAGEEFTAKDFRTWHGTVVAARELNAIGAADTKTAAKRNITQAIKAAAEYLGNTPAICRKSYVHPGILGAYQDGTLFGAFAETRGRARERNLDRDEMAVLSLLRGQEQAAQRVAS